MITVRRDGTQLLVNGLNNDETRLYQETNGRYFVTTGNTEYAFSPDGKGTILRHGGAEVYALTKFASAKIDLKSYDALVGSYKFTGEVTAKTRVTRDGDRLYVAFDTRRFELIPEDDHEFVIKSIPMKATFQRDATAGVTQDHLASGRRKHCVPARRVKARTALSED